MYYYKSFHKMISLKKVLRKNVHLYDVKINLFQNKKKK